MKKHVDFEAEMRVRRDNITAWNAERLGREQALIDIEKRGFAYAYEQSSVPTLGSSFFNDAKRFAYGYAQVVRGYWMACMP